MDKIRETASAIKPLNRRIMDQAQKRLDNLTTPPGSLGRLEELAKILAAVKEEIKPCLLYTSPSPRDLSTSRMPSSA